MTARYQISRESETDRKSESYRYEIPGESGRGRYRGK